MKELVRIIAEILDHLGASSFKAGGVERRNSEPVESDLDRGEVRSNFHRVPLR